MRGSDRRGSWRGLSPRCTSPLWGRSSCKGRCGALLRRGSSHAPCWGLSWATPLCGGRSRSRRKRCPPPWHHRRPRQGTEVQAVYLRGKPLERRRHQHIGQPVEDDVNLDPLARLTGQGIHKTASDLISFPDERPDEDLVLRSLDLVEHRLVEADPVRVDLQSVLARLHSYLGLVLPWESLPRTLAALAELCRRDEYTNDHRLQRCQSEKDPQSQSAQRREPGTRLRKYPAQEREHGFDYIECSAKGPTFPQGPSKINLIPTFGACARRRPWPPRWLGS